MSTKLFDYFTAQGCLPHQANFATKFVDGGATSAHLLLRPSGSGSAFAVAAIIRALTERSEVKLILLLVSAQTVFAQWKSILDDMNTGLPVEMLSSRRLRQLDFERPSGDSPLLERGIAVVNVRSIPHLNLKSVLKAAPWDFLILDGFDDLSPRVDLELGEHLINRRNNLRTLLVGRSPERFARHPSRVLEQFADSLSVTEWKTADLIAADGKRLIPELSFTWIPYRRSDEEIEFLADLQKVSSSYIDERSWSSTENLPVRRRQRLLFEQQMILQAASSSLFALEGRLQRSRHRKNEAAHGKFRPSNEDFEAEVVVSREDDEPNSEKFGMVDVFEFNEVLEPFRAQIEMLPADSKADALTDLLRSVADDRVCIITSLHETAQFLATVMREHRTNVAFSTEMLSVEDRENALEHFAKNGGTLIVTSTSMPPLISAETIVFYDVPSRPDVLNDQVGMLMQKSGFKLIRIYAFFDESGVLEIERNRPTKPFES